MVLLGLLLKLERTTFFLVKLKGDTVLTKFDNIELRKLSLSNEALLLLAPCPQNLSDGHIWEIGHSKFEKFSTTTENFEYDQDK